MSVHYINGQKKVIMIVRFHHLTYYKSCNFIIQHLEEKHLVHDWALNKKIDDSNFHFTSKGDAKIYIANLCNHLMLDVSSAPSTILSCQKAFCPKLPLLVMDAKKIVILYELPIQYLSNTNPVPASYLQIIIKWHCSISTLQRNWSRRRKKVDF